MAGHRTHDYRYYLNYHFPKSSRGNDVTDATSIVNSDVIPNSYKEARVSIEAAGWRQSMDEEMTNLRNLGCWTVIPRSSLPPNTPIMGTRWTYRKKTDENGTFTRYNKRRIIIVVVWLLKASLRYSVSTTLNLSLLLPHSSPSVRCSR